VPVPVVSTFFGIVIRMFYQEHGVPHFHAEHHGQHAALTFDGRVIAGGITSRTAMHLIARWTKAHRIELEANWRRLRAGAPLAPIAPLE
jgi:hypothetical protein